LIRLTVITQSVKQERRGTITARTYQCPEQQLTSLAVTPSVTRGGAKMQKTVTATGLTQSTDSETDGHAMVRCAAESQLLNWPHSRRRIK